VILGIDNILFFLALLPVVSFLYASVGHGGASGYLALMALFSFPPTIMKQTALLLNLFVAAVAFYHYYRAGHFHLKLFLPFALTSIPASFIGGMFSLDPAVYKKILGVLLLVTIFRIIKVWDSKERTYQEVSTFKGLVIGMVIGFFSGLIGIGGGIILTPVILLFHWGNMKQAAATSALFIWVNSASGISGQFSSGIVIVPQSFILVVIALVGGLVGAYFGSSRIKNRTLEYFLAVVLFSAALKLLFV